MKNHRSCGTRALTIVAALVGVAQAQKDKKVIYVSSGNHILKRRRWVVFPAGPCRRPGQGPPCNIL